MAKKLNKVERDGPARSSLILELQKCRSNGLYPITAAQLAARCGQDAGAALKLLTDREGKTAFVVAKPKLTNSPLALTEDASILAESNLLIDFAASEAKQKRLNGKKPKALAQKLDAIVTDSGIDKSIKDSFKAALQKRVAAGPLPANIAELVVKPNLTGEEFARKLLDEMQSKPHSSPGPVAESELKRFAQRAALSGDFAKAIKHAAFTSQAVMVNGQEGKAYLLRRELSAAWPKLMIQGLVLATAKSQAAKSGAVTTAFKVAEIAAAILPKKTDHSTAIAVPNGEFPPEIGWVRIKGEKLYFLRAAVEPVSADHSATKASPAGNEAAGPSRAQAASHFPTSFEAAFERVDARTGRRNFVKLHDLRRELGEVPRTEFDTGLRELRLAGRYTLNTSEGGAVRLTEEERAAGIQEGGSLLIYASRR